MVNASFVFGMDGDRPDAFDRTVAWAVEQGVETATFHIMTPYPGRDLVIRTGQVTHAIPLPESLPGSFGARISTKGIGGRAASRSAETDCPTTQPAG